MHSSLFGITIWIHWDLIVISKKLVFFHVYAAVISYRDTCLIIAKYLILLYLGEGRPWTYDTWSLVLVNLIIADMNAAVEHNYSILVVVYVIVFDPTKPSFYTEDAFTPRFI